MILKSASSSGLLNPTSLRQQAKELLRTRVILGQLEPGTLFSVQAIANELGVSITPIREAVMDLANAGILEIVRNRGFRVPELTQHDLDEIFELRSMLEIPAIESLANMHGKVDSATSWRSAHTCLEAAEAGDVEEFLRSDREFHMGLLSNLNNQRLITFVSELRDQARMSGLVHLASGQGLTGSAREHISILEAIESGDVEGSGTLMRQHLSHSRGIWAGVPEDADE